MLNQQDTVVLMNDDSLEDRGPSRLAPEIWLQMLPKTTIRNITTTCCLFKEIAQPLLFRRLIFQLFVSIFNVFYPSHCQQLYGERPHMVLNQNFTERYNKRVGFVIFSPWISSAIRSVGVLPTDDRSYCGNMEGSDAILFMTFIDSLPLFSNLSNLHFQQRVCSDKFWYGIARLPQLRTLRLTIEECVITLSSSTPPPVISIKAPRICTRFLIRDPPDKWFSRIHPDTVSIPNRLESLEDPRDRTVIPFGVGGFLVPEATHKGADITYQHLRF